MSKGKSWHQGLNFECHQCGHCCTFPGGTVFATEKEFQRISEHLNLALEEFLDTYTDDMDGYVSLISKPEGPCIFYDNGCTIYEIRPTQCRTYPFWNHIVKSPRKWEEEAKTCKGINRGKRWLNKDIKQLLKNMDQKWMPAGRQSG